jgi:hypothetical protein
MSSLSTFAGCVIILMSSLMTDDIWEYLLCRLFCKIQYHIWSQWNIQLLVIVGVADMFGNSCGDVATDLFSEYPSTRAGNFVWPEKCSGGERFHPSYFYHILCSPEDKWVVMR